MQEKQKDLDNFIENNSDEVVTEYFNRLCDNLEEAHAKEKKHLLLLIILLFLYFILEDTSFKTLNVGFIELENASIVMKVIPLLFVTVIFHMNAVTTHKKNLRFAINHISENRYKLHLLTERKQNNNYIMKIFLPFSFEAAIEQIFIGKASKTNYYITVLLILPIIIIAIIPLVLIVFMLWDMYQNRLDDTLGIICFSLTLWMSLILLFYVIKRHKNNKEIALD